MAVLKFLLKRGDLKLSDLSDLINDENGFLIKLRCENTFNTAEYHKIKNALISNSAEWKKSRKIPVEDVVAIMSIIDQLAGSSRFFDEDTAIKVEDACIEIEDIINDLI